MRYFTPQELMHSSKASILGINNWTDDPEIWANLHALVDNVLDPAREKLGAPIRVNSGWRSYETNIAVGGTKNSQHCRGEACDITCRDLNRLWQIIGSLPYDQRILYRKKGFIHVSFKRNGKNRQQTIYN